MIDTPISDATFEGSIPFKILSEVQEREIKWLWYPYIPRSAVTLIIGDGGYGKSWMTCAVAADLSKGRALPGQDAMPPQRVLMLSAEDGMSEIVKPKMRTLDADMSRIAVFDEGFVLRPSIVEKVVEAMKQFDAAVVFLDPLVVYMGGQVDLHRANETRAVMSQLTAAAKDMDTAVVAVHHIRKQAGGNLQHRTLGSVDLVNSTRSVLLADISKGGQRYVAHVKHNWSEQGPTLAYTFDGKSFIWTGHYTGSIDDSQEVSLTKRGAAKAFLIANLKDGPISSPVLYERAASDGLNERTLARAKKGVAKSIQTATGWYWALDDDAKEKVAQETLDKVVNDDPNLLAGTGNYAGNTLVNGKISRSEPDPRAAEQLLREIGRGIHPVKAEPLPKPPPPRGDTLDPSVLAVARRRLAAKELQ